MEYKDGGVATITEGSGGDWEVPGFASWFSNVDSGKDVVMPGAFQRTLKERPDVQFLWQHDPKEGPIGKLELLNEVPDQGLFFSSRLLPTRRGKDARIQAQAGLLGASIGYDAEKTRIRADGVRELHDVTLYEISLVTFAMNPKARVTGAKAVKDLILTAEVESRLARGQYVTKKEWRLYWDAANRRHERMLYDGMTFREVIVTLDAELKALER